MAKMIDHLEEHFGALTPERTAFLRQMEAEAQAEGVPICGPVVGRLLWLLARFGHADNILEVGAATGYSALHLAMGLAGDGRVVTIERDRAMAARARANVDTAGLGWAVEVTEGEALEVMESLGSQFDLVFLDHDKAQYAATLPLARRLLRLGGLLVADNTAFAGTADFTRLLRDDPHWEAVQLLCFLPLHSPEYDGLSLAVKVS